MSMRNYNLNFETVSGEDEVIAIIPVIYELPSHLLDDLISRLTPHALYHFHLHMYVLLINSIFANYYCLSELLSGR